MAQHLPFELWSEICLLLPRKDLSSLMRLNRLCYETFAPLYYESCTIKFGNQQTLEEVVSEISERGLGRGYIRYARELRLIFLRSPSEGEQTERPILRPAFDYPPTPASSPLPVFLEPHFTSPRSLLDAGDSDPPGGHSRAKHQRKTDCSARPAATHDDDFEFDTLCLQGLSSLSVYSIRNCVEPLSDSDNLVEMYPFIFMAPNLKHLHIQREIPAPVAMFKEEWSNLARNYCPEPVALLESITPSTTHERLLLKLAKTYMSCLKSLDIQNYADTAILTQLASAFLNLERLFIRLDPFGWRQADLYAHHPDSIAAIMAFPPLNYLCLRGPRIVSSVLDILESHGQTLRGLSLELTIRAQPFADGRDTGHKYLHFTAEDIPRLATLCPGLKEPRL
ncbi:hypothetical protein BDV19DRAFT_386191 [Aspergillus venezuelensis]